MNEEATSKDYGSPLSICLTVEQAANRVAIGRSNFRKLCELPDFPVLRLGNRMLVEAKGLSHWMEQHRGFDLLRLLEDAT